MSATLILLDQSIAIRAFHHLNLIKLSNYLSPRLIHFKVASVFMIRRSTLEAYFLAALASYFFSIEILSTHILVTARPGTPPDERIHVKYLLLLECQILNVDFIVFDNVRATEEFFNFITCEYLVTLISAAGNFPDSSV